MNSEFASKYCAPLFIEGKFYQTGHTVKTPNATVTFIKFEDELYFVTCKHVIKDFFSQNDIRNNFTCRLNFNNIDFDLSTLVPIDKQKTVAMTSCYCPTFNLSTEFDIALVKIDIDSFKACAQSKGKTYFDLDDYCFPRITDRALVGTFGWLNDTKEQDGKVLKTSLLEMAIELNGDLSQTQKSFSMHSTIKKVPSCSGMSGGPVIYFSEDKEYPIGIIYEGEIGSASFMTENDKIIYANTLTPELFKEWLITSKPTWKLVDAFKEFTPNPEDLEQDKHGITWFKANRAFNIVGKCYSHRI